MQKIYIIKHKYYHSQEEKKEKANKLNLCVYNTRCDVIMTSLWSYIQYHLHVSNSSKEANFSRCVLLKQSHLCMGVTPT